MYLRIIVHANEHMGQLVAYARMTGVVPPWSRWLSFLAANQPRDRRKCRSDYFRSLKVELSRDRPAVIARIVLRIAGNECARKSLC